MVKGIFEKALKAYSGNSDVTPIVQKGINQRFWQSLNTTSTGGFDVGGKSEWHLIASYENNDVVNTCVDMNAQAVASVGWRLLTMNKSAGLKGRTKKLNGLAKKSLRRKSAQADEAEVFEVVDHPIIDLLTTTNDGINGTAILKITVAYYEILGRSYWYLRRDGSGQIDSIEILKGQLVLPIRDIFGRVKEYQYTNIIDGKHEKVTLDVEDVVVYRNASVSDPYAGGTSWLRSVYDKVASSAKFTEYLNWLLDNRARPEVVVSPKGESSKETVQRLDKDFKDKNKGPRNGGVYTADEAVDVKVLTYSPTDLAPLQVTESMTKAVCNAAGIPIPLLIGDATRANQETSREQHARQTVLPRVLMVEQAWNDSLLPQFEGTEDMWIEFDNPIPEDDEFELDEQKVAVTQAQALFVSGAGTRNEFRQLLGLPPLEDDLEDYGDELLSPPAPDPVPQDALDDPEPVDEAPDAADGQETPAKGITIDHLLNISKSVSLGELDRATAINLAAICFNVTQDEAKQLVTAVTPSTKTKKTCTCSIKAKRPATLPVPELPDTNPKLKAILQGAFQEQEAHYLQQLYIHGKSSDDVTTKEADTGDEDKLPSEFVPLDQWNDELSHQSKPVLELQARHAADGRISAFTRIGASPDVFAVVPAEIAKATNQATLRFCKDTNATTAKNLNDALEQLREEIQDGLFSGDPIPEMADRVQKVFENATDDRAELIAHTETSRAVHTGQQIAAKKSGIVKGFKLLISSDACDLCQEFDGKEISLDGKFNEDDDYSNSPLPIHPFCRCTMTEILDMDALNDDDEEPNAGE